MLLGFHFASIDGCQAVTTAFPGRPTAKQVPAARLIGGPMFSAIPLFSRSELCGNFNESLEFGIGADWVEIGVFFQQLHILETTSEGQSEQAESFARSQRAGWIVLGELGVQSSNLVFAIGGGLRSECIRSILPCGSSSAKSSRIHPTTSHQASTCLIRV